MSLASLKAELERKKREAEAVKAAAAAAGVTASFVRKGDLDRVLHPTAVAGGGGASTAAATGAGSSTAAGSAAAAVAAPAVPARPSVPRAEVIKRLRKYGQVATYFGESDEQRQARLRRYEDDYVLDREDFAVPSAFASSSSSSSSSRHHARPRDTDAEGTEIDGPAAKRRRMDGGDDLDAAVAPPPLPTVPPSALAAVAADLASPGGGSTASSSSSTTAAEGGLAAGAGGAAADTASAASAAAATGTPTSASHASGGGAADAAGGGGGGGSDDEEGAGKARSVSADALAFKGKDDIKYVYKFFKGLMNEWEDELAARSDAQKRSAAGREATTLHRQSRDFMRPFFRRCKKRTLASDMRNLCVEIVDHCVAREYAKAGDAYVRLAIGNAAWPIGVSAVGLHERAAREKVAEGQQAHVMHDEETRKFVTIIKRLMTWAQKRYPADPSKSIYS